MKRCIPLFLAAALLSVAAAPASAPAAGLQDLQQFSDAFAELAARVKPAVVTVRTETKVSFAQQGTPFDEFFREHPFFRRMPQQPDSDVREGLGSGVIVNAEGYILTNNHVIAAGRRDDDGVADRIVVELSDMRTYDAEVVGRDPDTDLAVLKIDDGDALPFLEFGNSDELDVGEWVVAVGNPFGQLHTVTTGIVSAVGRGNVHLADYEDYIQTDAAINPGNSGGALVDTRGELVGINTAIVSRSGGYQGIGFAIPVNLAAKIMDQLIDHGEVRRGFLGVSIDDVSADVAAALELDSRKGVLVVSVMDDLPAQAAGLRAYDVIRKVDGAPTDTPAALRNHIAHTPPGTKVRLTVLRDGKEREFTIELADKEDVEVTAQRDEPSESEDLGVAVQTLTTELAAQLGFDEEARGVVVRSVQRGSAAARAGLRPRDLIVEIDRKPVGDVGDYEAALEKAEGRTMLMVQRATRQGPRNFILVLRLSE